MNDELEKTFAGRATTLASAFDDLQKQIGQALAHKLNQTLLILILFGVVFVTGFTCGLEHRANLNHGTASSAVQEGVFKTTPINSSRVAARSQVALGLIFLKDRPSQRGRAATILANTTAWWWPLSFDDKAGLYSWRDAPWQLCADLNKDGVVNPVDVIVIVNLVYMGRDILAP